jgi:hypothetical protein
MLLQLFSNKVGHTHYRIKAAPVESSHRATDLSRFADKFIENPTTP